MGSMDEANRLITEDGTVLPGYLVPARPEGLILVHEAFGLNEQIRNTARRYAAEGFTVFAPDLLGGRVSSDVAIGFKNVQLVNWKAAIERIRQSVAALSALGGGARVGILGFSFGGAVAISAAAHIPEIAGCVSVYGIPTPERANFSQIRCKVQGHFGRFDKQISNDRVDQLESRMQASGVSIEVHRYHAEHHFFNETRRETYSASNTELTFRRSVAFLRMQLTGSY
jgi:carboxymethylenebutenolidase